MDTELSDDYVAQIHAIQRIELRALEGGYLEEIFVDEGKPVREGQRMFQIKPTLYQAELDMARAEAQAAQIEFTNTELLAAKQVVSANELALAKAKLDKAQAEVALREAHRQFTAINAPFDGIMGLLEVRRGSLLEEGELLTTVSDNRHMWVYFNVTESEYLEYMACPEAERPKEVELILANNQVFDQVGTIETIEADFNNETGTIAFRATFPNPRGVLRHGETGKVRIKTPLKDALVIPQAATFEVLDHRFVFVVDKDGVVHQRRITVAEEVPHLFVVSEGLDEHERILFEGLRKVQDGSHVATKYLDPAELLKQLDLPAD
ncbi:MAG: efflux RND transporter periplasmic adaptor subunit [Planctomycetes bacterium]|nr:efflux RND transporter periplasmic adaptor subunit [Planctomycetota bacterium]